MVSRGQLVEIGGSFRIPDVMSSSGAILREVGTTNRTHLKDYVSAITDQTALLMKVHTSNYRIVGFTKDVPLNELATLGRERGLPVVEDLGSGCFINLTQFGLHGEITVQETVRAGADLVSFSGDKLLGGPQAGIIVGRKDLIERCRKNPITRALRVDKMTLAALDATLRLYRDERQALEKIPTLTMIALSPEELNGRAEQLASAIQGADPQAVLRVEVRTEFFTGGRWFSSCAGLAHFCRGGPVRRFQPESNRGIPSPKRSSHNRENRIRSFHYGPAHAYAPAN